MPGRADEMMRQAQQGGGIADQMMRQSQQGGIADRMMQQSQQRELEGWSKVGRVGRDILQMQLLGPLFAPKKSITSRLFQGLALGVAAPQEYARQAEQGTVMNRREAYEQPSYPWVQKIQDVPVLGWLPGVRQATMAAGMGMEALDVLRGRQKITQGPTARTISQLSRLSRAGEFLPTSPEKRSQRGEGTARAWILGIVEDIVADPITYLSAGPKSVYAKAARELERVIPSLSRELLVGSPVARRAAAVAPQEVEHVVGYWAKRGFESAFEGARPERMGQLVGEKAGRYAPMTGVADRIQMQVTQKRLSRALGTQAADQLMADASRIGNRAGRESMQTYWKIGIPFLEQRVGVNVKPTGQWRGAAMEAVRQRAPRLAEALQFTRRRVSTAIPGEPMVSDILRQAKTGVTQQTQDLGTTLAKAGARRQSAATRTMEFHHVYRRNQPVEALIQEVDAIRAQNLAPQTKAAYLRSHYMLPAESFDEADQTVQQLLQGAKAGAEPAELGGTGQKYAGPYLEARSKLSQSAAENERLAKAERAKVVQMWEQQAVKRTPAPVAPIAAPAPQGMEDLFEKIRPNAVPDALKSEHDIALNNLAAAQREVEVAIRHYDDLLRKGKKVSNEQLAAAALRSEQKQAALIDAQRAYQDVMDRAAMVSPPAPPPRPAPSNFEAFAKNAVDEMTRAARDYAMPQTMAQTDRALAVMDKYGLRFPEGTGNRGIAEQIFHRASLIQDFLDGKSRGNFSVDALRKVFEQAGPVPVPPVSRPPARPAPAAAPAPAAPTAQMAPAAPTPDEAALRKFDESIQAALAEAQSAAENKVAQALRTAVWKDLKADMADSYLRVAALAEYDDVGPIQRALQSKTFPQGLSLAGKEVWQQLRKLPAENVRTAILEGSSLGFRKRTDYVAALRQLTREYEPAIREITRVTKLGEELLNSWGLNAQEKGLIDNMLEGYMASIREGTSFQLERQWKDWARKTLQAKYGTVSEDALERVAFMVREAPKADNLALRLLQDVDDGVVKDLEAAYMRTLMETGGVTEMPGFRLPSTTEEARHILSGMGARRPGFSQQQVLGPLNALRAGFSTVIDYPQMVRTRGVMQFAAVERHKLGQFGMLWGVPRSMMLENPSKYRGFITLEDYARKIKASGAQVERVWPELSSKVDPLMFPEDIAHNLVSARVLSLDDPGMTWVNRGYMTMLRSYKAGATISRPAWASVNVQGAVVNNVIQGVTNPARYYTGAALVGGPVGDFFARQASIFDRGVMKVRNGAFFVHTPAGDIPLEQARRLVEQKGILSGWTKDVMGDLPPQKMSKLLEGLNRELNPLSPDFWVYYPVKTAGAWSESVTKTTLFADRLVKGHHPNMAARTVVETHFDYSDLTEAEKIARTYVWPFFAWLRKNAAYQLKTLAEHPKLAVLAPQVLIGLEQAGPQEDRVPKAELPDWLQNDMTIQLPNLKTESGDPIFVTFRLPIMDLNRVFSIRQILSSVGVAKLIPELVFNKSLFMGRAIDTKKDYYQGRAREVMHDWVPVPPGLWWIALAPDMFLPTGHVKIAEPDEKGNRHVLMTAQFKYALENSMPIAGTMTRYAGGVSEPAETGEETIRIGRFRGPLKWVGLATGISMRSFNRQKLYERFQQEQKDIERAQHKQGVQLGTEPPTLREYEESQKK